MQYQVGAILWHPRTGRKLYTMATVPDTVVQSWIPKRQMIGQVELFGAEKGPLLCTLAQVSAEKEQHKSDIGCSVCGCNM
eukprot:4912708-Amphidinium_carterae.1